MSILTVVAFNTGYTNKRVDNIVGMCFFTDPAHFLVPDAVPFAACTGYNPVEGIKDTIDPILQTTWTYVRDHMSCRYKSGQVTPASTNLSLPNGAEIRLIDVTSEQFMYNRWVRKFRSGVISNVQTAYRQRDLTMLYNHFTFPTLNENKNEKENEGQVYDFFDLMSLQESRNQISRELAEELAVFSNHKQQILNQIHVLSKNVSDLNRDTILTGNYLSNMFTGLERIKRDVTHLTNLTDSINQHQERLRVCDDFIQRAKDPREQMEILHNKIIDGMQGEQIVIFNEYISRLKKMHGGS